MHKQVLEKILSQFEIDYKEIFPPQKGYRNRSYRVKLKDGRELNLIVYKRESGILRRIKSAHRVANFLSRYDLPVRTPVSKVLRLSSGRFERFVCLYEYLPGETIPWEGYSQKHVKLLGKTLSDMHFVLGEFPHKGKLPIASDELKEMNARMSKYFARKDVASAIERKLKLKINRTVFEKNRKLLDVLGIQPQQIPLHLDFVRSNVLFAGEGESLEISGILDFEKVAWGAQVIDIARTLAFLIVDCKYKPELKVRKYFLQSGYQKRGKNDLPDLKLLPGLLKFFWMYDFYKFLLHNPYESLQFNEHFVRTKDQLRGLGVLI